MRKARRELIASVLGRAARLAEMVTPCVRAMAMDERGNAVVWSAPSAVRFCAEGILMRAEAEESFARCGVWAFHQDVLEDALAAVLAGLGGWRHLSDWNDARPRSGGELADAFLRGIPSLGRM